MCGKTRGEEGILWNDRPGLSFTKGYIRMPLVKVKENESIDKAIRRFKKKCEKEGIIQDIKKSSRYLKPSERKRKKQLKAAKRRRSGKA
jgi:small subunit ribosomal protein S21